MNVNLADRVSAPTLASPVPAAPSASVIKWKPEKMHEDTRIRHYGCASVLHNHVAVLIEFCYYSATHKVATSVLFGHQSTLQGCYRCSVTTTFH